MSELFNEAFGKVFTKENLSDIPEAKWVFPDKGGIGLCNISFDEASVLKSLEKLRDDKAVGADELNLIKQELACPLTILFQSIMACESVPDDWKEANVVLVYKGGSRNVATNYRPISLTSKVFDTIVRDQVIEFMETNVIIRNSQRGFRKGSSCLTNLLLFLDKVLHSVNNGFSVDVVFLDLAKAFEKVPHKRLLEKLSKDGIRGKLLSVIGNWLSNRKQRVLLRADGQNGLQYGVGFHRGLS